MRAQVIVGVACTSAALAACSSSRPKPAESARGEVSLPPIAPFVHALSFTQLSGRWNMRAVPVTGDTTSTTYLLTATSSAKGWTITFPNRKPIPARVVKLDADSVVIETGSYESVRRPDVTTTMRAVYRLIGDDLVGTAVSRYRTASPDSVVRFRVEGSHAP